MGKRLFVLTPVLWSMLAASGVGSWAADSVPQQLQQIRQQLQSIQAALDGIPKPRKYYLTKDPVAGASNAPTACAAGYHMAHLFEILDTTNLVYETTLGMTTGDSGSGPPTGEINVFGPLSPVGWIRTGFPSSGSVNNTAGNLNCSGYTSSNPSSPGTGVQLAANWYDDPKVIAPWEAQTISCAGTLRVWCVQDR